MKNILTTIFCGVGLLLSTRCQKDFEKINTNPNRPQKPLSYALFNSSDKLILSNTRVYTTSGQMMRSWMQYTAQTTYTTESRFLYRDNSGDYLWRYPYKAAGNYKDIIELNTDPKTKNETAKYGSNANQIAAARIMMAFTFNLLVETFGDIPYYSWGGRENPNFQALQMDKYISPKYATQKEIYMDLLKELKEATDQIDESQPYVFIQGDRIFGTPQKMKRFANSLRLRIAVRVHEVTDSQLRSLANETINELKDGTKVMQSNADTVERPFDNDNTNPSPIFRNYYVNNRTDYAPANSFVQLLKGQRGNYGVDPRLQKYFAVKGLTKYQARDGYQESTDLSKYVGMPYGMEESMADFQFNSGRDVSFFGKRILKADYAEVYMEYAEVCFLLSEVNGWDSQWYKKGVIASMEKWGVDTTVATNFANGLPTANKENVITQKYIALYMNPNEAWAEYRRTGYPQTLIKVGETVPLNKPTTSGETTYTFTSTVAELTDLPERLYYPTTYKLINFENYKEALKNMNMSEDSMAKKLIFARH